MSLISVLQTALDAIEYMAKQNEGKPISEQPAPIPETPKGVMTMSKEGKIELANYEALANTCYYDSVREKTVSIGLTKSDIPDIGEWAWDKFLSDEQAVRLYTDKLEHYISAVRHELRVKVKQHEFDALVSITYNIGTGNLETDKGGMAGSTFIDLVNAKADPKYVVNAMAQWNKGTIKGKRVVIKGLVNRRAKERELYLSGKYLNDGSVGRIVVSPTTHQPKYSGRVKIAQYI